MKQMGHRAQDTRAVFEDWIKRFKAEYIQVVKDADHAISSLNVKENESFIYISSDFKWYGNDYYVIAQRKSDGHIFVVDTFTLALPFASIDAHVELYKELGYALELASVEHLNVAMMASDNLGEFYALCEAMGT